VFLVQERQQEEKVDAVSKPLASFGLALFERSRACFAKIQKLGLAPSDSLHFYASLHQERFATWSKRDVSGSHQSLAAMWITDTILKDDYALCSDNDLYLNHVKNLAPISRDTLK